jgi:uncharacterized Zn finger protein
VPWIRSEPFSRGRITTRSGEVVALGLGAGLVDALVEGDPDGCGDGASAVVTVDVHAATAKSNRAMLVERGREPTVRR